MACPCARVCERRTQRGWSLGRSSRRALLEIDGCSSEHPDTNVDTVPGLRGEDYGAFGGQLNF